VGVTLNKRGTGVTFICLAAIMFIFRNAIYYLCGAILSASNGSMHTNQLNEALAMITPPYSNLPAIVCLIIGIGYLLWSEITRE
jgi:hypothetical protein